MKLDVAIIGGGLAGSTLARQLRRQLPELAIGCFERTNAGAFKVGESTVEIASNYLVRRLGLGNYLYQNHLPKNGLRFFFDDEKKSTPIAQMSEIGSDALPFHPSFQIDRARLESDLWAMNRADGVHVATGARVLDVRFDAVHGSASSGASFTVAHDDRIEQVSARWLIDTSGRARVLQRTLKRSVPDVGHPIAAVWGRFERVRDIDAAGDEAFRARSRHTARFLSTTHFCYPGYWIWFIPLGRGVTSVGLVCEHQVFTPRLRKPEGFMAFLQEHRAVAELLEGSIALDLLSYGQLGYAAERFFGPDRIAATGEAAAFSDPFYSPGSDFIAMENDYVTDLVARDVAGVSSGELEQRTGLYEAFMQFRFEQTMRLYRGQYSLFGSYPLMKLKWNFDIACYYNSWFHAYSVDEHLCQTWLEDQLRQREFTLNALNRFAELFGHVERNLRERGQYFRDNSGEFSNGIESFGEWAHEIGRPRTRKQMLRRTGQIFNLVREQALHILADGALPSKPEPLPLYDFLLDRPLV